MKTVKLLIALFCLFATQSAMAQEKGDINLSAGFSGMHLDNALGLAVGAEYMFAQKFGVAAGLLYSEASNTNPVRFESLLSLDFRYYFLKKGISAYAYSGYGIHQAQGLVSPFDGIRNFHSATFGAGVEYGVSENLNVYLQSKGWYNEEGSFQTFNLGVAFRLKKKK
ncbi:MAG: porin family protein [Roseivirga sp.]|nr:porin family protein [Roseivirga sp.]